MTSVLLVITDSNMIFLFRIRPIKVFAISWFDAQKVFFQIFWCIWLSHYYRILTIIVDKISGCKYYQFTTVKHSRGSNDPHNKLKFPLRGLCISFLLMTINLFVFVVFYLLTLIVLLSFKHILLENFSLPYYSMNTFSIL